MCLSMSKHDAICLQRKGYLGQAWSIGFKKAPLSLVMAKRHEFCRTQLEAEAYAAHIAGLHLLEYSHRQPAALAKLQRAQSVPLIDN